jgi:hypothetical protein
MTQDYIMRLVLQIAAALAGIVAKQKAGDFLGAKAELNLQVQQAIGLNISEVRRLAPEAIAQLLESSGALRQSRAVVLAELLLKDAEMTEGDDSQATADYLHAFCLLADTFSTLDADDQATYRPRLQSLAEQLRGFQTHPYIRERLRHYEDKEGEER